MENTNTIETVKFATDRRYRLAVDPRGAHVTLNWRGRKLIGEVYGAYWNEVQGGTKLQVRHFDGSNWPLDPAHFAVDVLVRR